VTASAAPAATCVHTVRAGDSISLIARRYAVTRQSVISENQLAKPDALKLGQRLTIPRCGQGRAGKAPSLEAAVVKADGVLLARVGPRRVPTQLYLGVPDPSVRTMDFTWPIEGSVASPFGRRRSGWHAGIDIKADAGTPILAAAPGTVVFSGWAAAYGRVVKIEHDNGFLSLYAHNLQNLVQVGDRVDVGTLIATVGRTGRATAYHLHFEIRQNGTVYDPLYLLASREPVLARADENGEPLSEDDVDE
jgi:murein DD-endopeptidase MepM/ murein hydrolase activator NlpD